jgi:hypothetical protein
MIILYVGLYNNKEKRRIDMGDQEKGIQKQISDLIVLKKECQMKINEYDKIIKRLYTRMKKK